MQRGAGKAVALILAALAVSSCAGDGYYRQAVSGQIEVMRSREDIAALVADPATPDDLRRQLELVTAALAFAVEELALPDNGSYRTYADIGRPFTTWNVFAAPPLSLDPVLWCFPVVGCVAYRGYYDRDDAVAFGEGVAAEGYEVFVGGSRAYSTLGYFKDPVPSTIIFDADYDLVATIFHELAHQRVYLAGDTTFNESYATAVERAGLALWLDAHGTPELRAAYERDRQRQEEFLALVLGARNALDALFRSSASDADKLAGKDRVYDELRADYARLRASWGGYDGYDGYFAVGLNNAKLGLVATYNSGVEAFSALLAESGDWASFHAAVEALAALPEDARNAELARLAGR